MEYLIFIGVVCLFFLRMIRIVPQQQVWVIERLGKYHRKMEAGLHIIVPIIERIAQKHSLKEMVVDVHEQTAITKDNVSVRIDGILYMKVIEPVAATYGVADAQYALTQLAQTTMRSEIGKIALDKTFEEREMLNHNIVRAINEASHCWGIQCMRYEIKDIDMPEDIRKAMELQMTAERQKRARILESEGFRQAAINESEGKRQGDINRAEGEAKSLLMVAEATAEALQQVANSLASKGGEQAANLRVAEQYIEAFRGIAKESTTLVLPAGVHDVGSMTAQALSVFNTLTKPKVEKRQPKVPVN